MPLIRLSPSGKEVACRSDQTVLDALEQAGYALPNNCRAGACGECKTRVLAGEFDQGFVMDMALSPEDRSEGFGLMCMAKPTSEVLEIEYGTADAQPKLFPPRQGLSFIVVDKIPRTPSLVEVRLRPVGERLRYWPGQYITLGDALEGIPERPYSIANAPRPDGEISLIVSAAHRGVTSTWILEVLQAGDVVSASGPYGTFIGDPSVEEPVLCLAAGSGLAPILALSDAALRRGFSFPVTILFSARTQAEVFAKGLMVYWEHQYANFQFIRTLTREPGPAPTGRIPRILPELFPDLSCYSVFVAGSPSFVSDCVEVALDLGAREGHLHTEKYFDQFQPVAPPMERLLSSSRA
jgi:CDP-4-dehydro-6-deoxyglucose reductase